MPVSVQFIGFQTMFSIFLLASLIICFREWNKNLSRTVLSSRASSFKRPLSGLSATFPCQIHVRFSGATQKTLPRKTSEKKYAGWPSFIAIVWTAVEALRICRAYPEASATKYQILTLREISFFYFIIPTQRVFSQFAQDSFCCWTGRSLNRLQAALHRKFQMESVGFEISRVKCRSFKLITRRILSESTIAVKFEND